MAVFPRALRPEPKVAQGMRSGIVPGMAVPQLSLSAGEEFECAIGAASIAHHESFDVSNIELEVIESIDDHLCQMVDAHRPRRH